MKTIIAPFVRKVLAIHPDDHVINQEMLDTMFAVSFMLLCAFLISHSLWIFAFEKLMREL